MSLLILGVGRRSPSTAFSGRGLALLGPAGGSGVPGAEPSWRPMPFEVVGDIAQIETIAA